MEAWTRVIATTINKHIRDVEKNMFRRWKWLAAIQSGGRMSFNNRGKKFDWPVEYRRAAVTGYADTDTMSFSRVNRWTTAELDYRGYNVTDSLTKFEELANQSVEAIVKWVSGMVSRLTSDMEEAFNGELFKDGNAAANLKGIHGIESFMGTSGTQAAGYVATPSDTYAGLSTVLGNKGGSWSENGSSQVEWPSGYGDSHYDYWTPIIVDYTDTAWAATTKTWANTCIEALRYGIMKSGLRKNAKGKTDFVLLENELYRLFKEAYEPTQRINVMPGKQGGLISLGFADVTNFEGTEVTDQYGVTANVGYGISLENEELLSMQGTLFDAQGPDLDISSKSKRFSVDFFGNMKFNPRAHTKYINAT